MLQSTSCSSPWARVRLQEQVRVLSRSYPRPRATPWPRRAWFSRPVGLSVRKQRIQPADCAPLQRGQPRAKEAPFSDNLLVELIKAILRDLQNGVIFLFQQPKELQYLEFPSLKSAGKMAIFTIAVVMVLIVFLATVDSAFSYIVASMFRRIK